MSEVNISYKGNSIATMDASGTKTLQTSGKYCEDNIQVVYTRPSGGDNDFSVVAVTVTNNTEYDLYGDMPNIQDYGEEYASYSSNAIFVAGETATYYMMLYKGVNWLSFPVSYLITITVDGSSTQSEADSVDVTEACTIVIDEII